MKRHEPGVVAACHKVARFVHAEGREDAFPHERIHGLTGDRLHQVAQHAGAFAVRPPCARIVQQRETKLAGRRTLGAEKGEENLVEDIVTKPGGMREQVAHGHPGTGGTGREAVIRGIERFEDLLRQASRQVHGRWIVQTGFALLHQHHDGSRRDRFGHGGDPEDRIHRHRKALRHIPAAERASVDDAVSVGDQAHDSRDVRVADDLIQIFVDHRSSCVGNRGRLRASVLRADQQVHQRRQADCQCSGPYQAIDRRRATQCRRQDQMTQSLRQPLSLPSVQDLSKLRAEQNETQHSSCGNRIQFHRHSFSGLPTPGPCPSRHDE